MHYAMSDIHGHYKKYLEILEKINFSNDDTLYIIGDVIDKGEDSGRLLLDILTDKRVVCLLGNHEYMMIESIHSMKNLRDWYLNGAEKTIEQLEEQGLKYSDLISEISKFPIIIPKLKINNKNFYLCHAFPLAQKFNNNVYIDDLDKDRLFDTLWNRQLAYNECDLSDTFKEYPETYFLIGHTPTYHCDYGRADKKKQPMISLHPNGKIINLDCGCAGNKRLGCLRLEDFAEFYA